MKYHLFPYNDDESATILHEPIVTIDTIPPALPKEIDHALLAEIYFGLQRINLKEGEQPKYSMEDLMRMTMDQIAQDISENMTYDFSHVAIVPHSDAVLQMFSDVGEALFELMGDDSSTYRAALAFARILETHSVAKLPFPMWEDND